MQTKSFSDLITFTRATTGTWLNPATGLLETAAINVPRLEAKGLLFEQQRTNIALQSNTFSSATWAKSGSSVGASVTSPDGTANAVKLVESATTGTHFFNQSGKVVSGNTRYCRSVFAKAGDAGRYLQLITDNPANWVTNTNAVFDLTNGTILSQSPAVNDGVGIEPWGNGWYRCWLVGTTIATPAAVNVVLYLSNGTSNSYAGDGSSGIYVYGAQFEAGDSPSSYIATSTAQVTRALDSAFVPQSNWLMNSEGTLFCEYSPHGVTANRVAANLGSADPVPRVMLWIRGAVDQRAGGWIVSNSGATLYSQVGGPIFSPNQVIKHALAYSPSDAQFSVSGVMASAGSLSELPNIDRLTIGARGVTTDHIQGHLRRIKYFPYRLTAAELQALTT